VIRQGMTPVVIGVLAGVTAAIFVGRMIQSLLFGVAPNDPLTIAGVALTLLIAGILACLVPARRAMRVDPMVALRHE